MLHIQIMLLHVIYVFLTKVGDKVGDTWVYILCGGGHTS